MADPSFQHTMTMFYGGEYEQGKEQITNLIMSDPSNPNLYLNRALFLSQMGMDAEAIGDLQICLSLNPRSHIAYFNLFSIQTRYEQWVPAYNSLCCSLSCLYLIKARNTKSLQDAETSIRHAHNNYEAHVLKGLLHLQQKEHQQAIQSLQKAQHISQQNPAISTLLNTVRRQQNPGLQEADIPDAEEAEKQDKLLKGSLEIQDPMTVTEATQAKLEEFNRLYNEVNDQVGAVTHKINKQVSVIRSKPASRARDGQDDCIMVEDQGMPTPQDSLAHPEVGNLYMVSSSFVSHNNSSEFVSIAGSSSANMSKTKKEQESSQKQSEFVSVMEHSDVPEKVVDEDEGEFESVIELQAESQVVTPSSEGFTSLVSEPNQASIPNMSFMKAEKCYIQAEEEDKFESVLKADTPEPEISQAVEKEPDQGQHYNLIYPLQAPTILKIKAIGVNFVSRSPEQLAKLTDVYCIIAYHPKQKLITKPVACVEGVCEWNQEFEGVEVLPQPSDMKVKVYNKRYHSFRDELLGDMEVLITTADLLKLPLYHKGNFVGNLLIQLDLQDPPVKKEEGQEEEQEVINDE